MKRKRNQTEEIIQNGNGGKKYRPLCESFAKTDSDDLDISLASKKEEFVLTREIAEHEILSDISGKKWRVGVPVGKGSFGEIFLASEDTTTPVNRKNSNFVIKIEPHSNGPLFVEIHCLLNVNKRSDEEEDSLMQPPLDEDVGIPKYIASGSHYFSDSRYRFLIMPRYKADLHSILKYGRLSQRHFLIIASQIIDVLKHLHGKHYVHSDIKAENIMIGLCKPSQMSNDSKSLADVVEHKSNRIRSKKDNSLEEFYSNSKRSLRPARKVAYIIDENSRSSNGCETFRSEDEDSDQDEDFDLSPRKKKAQKSSKRKKIVKQPTKAKNSKHEEYSDEKDDERVYVIDYGLATKFMNLSGESNVHKPFCCDERRAHDGTLEFTSRDAHFGAHSRRSDLECLGYNLIYWSQGFLPWKDEKLKEQPEIVHRLKEIFMTDVKEILKLLYGKDVPKYLGEFMFYVKNLEFDEEPDYKYLKGLFEKEFVRLGFKKGDMKLNLNEMRNECDKSDKSVTENELMLSKITDITTARKLGFLIATDSQDGSEIQTKSNEMMALNISCKASPKNLRSKEKSKGKRPKRQAKITEKEVIYEKMSQGKKISLGEIALLDPDQFARARADREYERSDEKTQMQSPQKYQGNPTYAILEVENRLKLRQSGSAAATAAAISNVERGEVEPIKGYTKQMMDVLKKQQIMVEKQILTPTSKRSRGKLKSVAPPTKKQNTGQVGKPKKGRASGGLKPGRKAKKEVEPVVEANEAPECEAVVESSVKPAKPLRSKRGPKKQKAKTVSRAQSNDETTCNVEEVEKPVKRKRGRPKVLKSIIETQDTEEDSVYYDIPGEGSNYDAKELSEEENIPAISVKSVRKESFSSDENSNHDSVNIESNKSKKRGRYYTDEDYDISSSEASSISDPSEIIQNTRRKQTYSNTKLTRNKTKSRSTSVSATVFAEESDVSERSEMSETDYEMQSGDESEAPDYDQSDTEEEEEESLSETDDSNCYDSNDSIDFKYSPITKTRQTRRADNVKTSKGRKTCPNVLNVRNFRLISTQG